MAKKQTTLPENKQADYYKLHADAANRLVNTTKENTPRYSQEELNRYKGGKKKWRLPEAVKVVLIKFWFFGAICYFVFMGLGMYLVSVLDQLVVSGVITGMVMDLLMNHFLRFTEKLPGGSQKWMMVTKRGMAGVLMNLLYGFVLTFAVVTVYNLVNALLSAGFGAVAKVEPILFGVFATAVDLLLIFMKRTLLKIVADANDTDIVIINTQAPQEFLIGAVTDLGIGDIRQDLLHQLLLVIHRHDLVVQLPELHGDVLSETAKAN